jgi:hypothetical protein
MNCDRCIFAGPVRKEPGLAGLTVDVTRDTATRDFGPSMWSVTGKGRGRLLGYVQGEMRDESSENRQSGTCNRQIPIGPAPTIAGMPKAGVRSFWNTSVTTEVTTEVTQILGALDGERRSVRGRGRS